MAGNPYLWSTTAASNDSIDPDVSWIEGQLPGTVNNSARAMMAGIAGWLKDNNGTTTTGGSANAQTFTAQIAYSALATGIKLLFKAGFANTGAATLNMTPAGGAAFGAKPIKVLGPSGERDVGGNQIRAGGHYLVEYDAAANSGSGAWILLNPTVRIRAVAPQFFVRPDGNDSNDGLANTSGRAFRTIQQAVNTALFDYDCGNSTASISVAPGTYAPFDVFADGVGSNQVAVIGDTATPGNCIINTPGGACVTAQDKGILSISGFKLTGPGPGLFSRGQSSVVDFNAIHFGAGITTCVFVGGAGGSANGAQNCNVLNNVVSFLTVAGSGASADITGGTITLTGTPAFSGAVVVAQDNGTITASGVAFTGAATGQKFLKLRGGRIQDVGVTWPGSVAGTDDSVFGPQATVADNRVVRWDGNTGTLVQQSTVTIDDSGNVSGVADLTTTGSTTLGDGSADQVMVNAKKLSRPNMPAFSAYNSVADTNATGDGTNVTVDFDTEVFDLGGDFASNTFTAPFTGKYDLRCAVSLTGIASTHTDLVLQIVTTARTYRGTRINPSQIHVSGGLTVVCTVAADMTAGDTATVQISVNGTGGKVVGINGNATGNPLTYFQGRMIG